jgi:hypothetical protein
MSIRRRLTALEHHARAAGALTSPNRLSREEIDAVVDLAMGGDAEPVPALSPAALAVLPRVRQFAEIYDELAIKMNLKISAGKEETQ